MRKLVTILYNSEIDVHSYKTFRESIRSDRLIKLINLILRSAECGLLYYSIKIALRIGSSLYKILLTNQYFHELLAIQAFKGIRNITKFS